MEEHNISTQDFSNYLQMGAILRFENNWHLYVHPFHSDKPLKSECFSIYTRDFFNSQTQLSYEVSTHWILTTSQIETLCLEFLRTLDPIPCFNAIQWQEPFQETFQISFTEIKRKISQRQIVKAVPIVFESAEGSISSGQRALMILQLLKAPSNLWVYGNWNNQSGVLGATPELLFELNSQKIFTMALAGTRPKIDQNRLPLLKDSKELQEHQLVVQDLVDCFSPFGGGEISGPSEIEYPTIFHLKTELKINLCEAIDPLKLIECLHPTAALGVSPRNYGFQWMQNLPDQKNRQIFGSPILYKIKENHWLCLVAIRNIIWDHHNIRLGAGCGIVESSLLDREWNELKAKRTFTKNMLGLGNKE